MKRESVPLDLLAAMTADALFGGSPQLRTAESDARERPRRLNPGHWFKSRAGSVTSKPATTGGSTLDDDWVGGWYARSRSLQHEALARAASGAPEAPAPVTTAGDTKRLEDDR